MSDKYCYAHHRHHHYGNSDGGGCLVILGLCLIALPFIGIYKMITSKDEGVRLLGIVLGVILVVYIMVSS